MMLWLDEEVKMLLVLGDKFGKPLFELAPHLFPDRFITDTEKLLWMYYFKNKAKIMEPKSHGKFKKDY